MGSAQSVPASTSRVDEPTSTLPDLSALSLAGGPPVPKAITPDQIGAYSRSYESDDKNILASTVLSKQDWGTALTGRKVQLRDNHVYNNAITGEQPVTNQLSSGRCWLFAATNVIRVGMIKSLDLGDFQLSQSYLFFYDSLAKSNWFLEQMIDLADTPLDDRTVQYLLQEPQNDGGQYEMAINLISNYGLVPQAVFPESHNSSNTSRLDGLLTSKLREYALALRATYTSVLAALEADDVRRAAGEMKVLAQQGARKLKEAQMEEIYRILAISLGRPPLPDEKFEWEYYTKDKKKAKSITCTPKEFYASYAGVNVEDNVSLIHDPRNAPSKAYTVQRLGNVVGGRKIKYINTEISTLKQVAISLIQSNQSVWFGCDVGASSNSALGLMDTELYDLSKAFGVKLGMTKVERLQTGETAMTHAMCLTAVHLSDAGEPIRWRVENSWGDARGDKGYFLMTDDWFSEHVFQVVANRKFVPKELLKVLDGDEITELPPWDPMGSLA